MGPSVRAECAAPSGDLEAWSQHPRLQGHLHRFENADKERVLARYQRVASSLTGSPLLRHTVHVGAWVALLPVEHESLPACVRLLAALLRLRGRCRVTPWLRGVLHLVALRLRELCVGECKPAHWMELKRSMPRQVWKDFRAECPALPAGGDVEEGESTPKHKAVKVPPKVEQVSGEVSHTAIVPDPPLPIGVRGRKRSLENDAPVDDDTLAPDGMPEVMKAEESHLLDLFMELEPYSSPKTLRGVREQQRATIAALQKLHGSARDAKIAAVQEFATKALELEDADMMVRAVVLIVGPL